MAISTVLVIFVYYFSVFNEVVEVVNIDEAIVPWRCTVRIRTDERADMFYKALCTLMHRMWGLECNKAHLHWDIPGKQKWHRAVTYASPKEANRHPAIFLLYTCFVNVSSVGLVTVRSHLMHLVNTLLGVILSSNKSISAVFVLLQSLFGLLCCSEGWKQAHSCCNVGIYFLNVSSVGMITVSGNLVLLVNALWGLF